jgi:hypothetical protein
MSDAVVLARRASWSGVGFVIAAFVCVATPGCRTSSWTPPSSWSMFGSPPKNSEKLAASAPAAGEITKPSATAQPYPTTSTPEGYSLAAGAGPTAGQSAAPPAMPAEPGPIVYGSRPVPSSVAAAGPTDPYASVAPPMSSIAPQVGPYATSGSEPPPGISAGSLPATPEAMPYASPPAARLAENPPSLAGSPAAPSAAPPAGPAAGPPAIAWEGASADAATAESRYASGGSRFSSPFQGASPAGQTPASAWPAPPAAGSPPTPPPTSETAPGFQPLLAPPPAAVPGGTGPWGAVPGGGPPSLPPALPVSAPAASPATQRRPDPGYRPGGTSSYRPGSDMVPGQRTVQPVSFTSPPPWMPPPQ